MTQRKKNKKIGVLFIAILAVISSSAIVAFFISSQLHPTSNVTQELQFGVNDFKQYNNAFHLTADTLNNDAVSIPLTDELHGRSLLRTKATALLKTKSYPPHLSHLTLSLNYSANDANLYAHIPCKECKEPLSRLPLYIQGMEHMHKHALADGVFFYTSHKIDGSLGDYNMEQVINDVVPANSSVVVTEELYPQLQFNEITQLADSRLITSSTLQHPFYPDQEFLLYAPEVLEVEIKKQNNNSIISSDEVTVQLVNMYGEEIFKSMISDDGIRDATKERTSQTERFTIDLSERGYSEGVYKLQLQSRENADCLITELSVNTDQIVFTDATIIGSSTIYGIAHNDQDAVSVTPKTRGYSPITFYSGQDTVQEISVQQQQHLDKELYVSTPQEYSISAESSFQLSGGYFSPNKETLFTPYVVHIMQHGDVEYYFTHLDFATNANATHTGTNTFSHEQLTALQAVESLKHVTLDIIMQLPISFNRYEKENLINEYNRVYSGCGIDIYYDADNYLGDTSSIECENDQIASYILEAIPQHESLYLLTDLVQQHDILDLQHIDDFSSKQKTITIQEQHDITAAFYQDGELHMQLTKKDFNAHTGKEDVLIQIHDINDVLVYETLIRDDGNTSTDQQISSISSEVITVPDLHGIYYLTTQVLPLDKKYADYTVESISINTNKFVLIEPTIIGSEELYFSTDRLKDVEVHTAVLQESTAQEELLTVQGEIQEQFALENTNPQKIILTSPPGDYQLSTGALETTVIGTDVALTPDGYFSYKHYEDGVDFIAIDTFTIPDVRLYSLTAQY